MSGVMEIADGEGRGRHVNFRITQVSLPRRVCFSAGSCLQVQPALRWKEEEEEWGVCGLEQDGSENPVLKLLCRLQIWGMHANQAQGLRACLPCWFQIWLANYAVAVWRHSEAGRSSRCVSRWNPAGRKPQVTQTCLPHGYPLDWQRSILTFAPPFLSFCSTGLRFPSSGRWSPQRRTVSASTWRMRRWDCVLTSLVRFCGTWFWTKWVQWGGD